jgi:hypothetical protein
MKPIPKHYSLFGHEKRENRRTNFRSEQTKNTSDEYGEFYYQFGMNSDMTGHCSDRNSI